ncbi:hypothetical protein EJ065_2071 [Corallococcus coralloides]|uniref:Uncharacterized protein n=1 Tax=Corallococcus coralloides TaxID=184914 RepID=A0A410RNW7_CORCK|nr:hypothetical protein EJ065_2071 [Corallococcus coralloides]
MLRNGCSPWAGLSDAVEGALVATEAFQALLGQMRVERILQKYHRSLRGPSAV